MNAWFGHLWLARLLLQRGVAAVYLIAFIAVLLQFKPLLGERGLLPVPDLLKRTTFRQVPSLFHWRYSDRLLTLVAIAGIILSLAALFGLIDSSPIWFSVSSWLLLWFLYLSIVNVGQKFFGFGWESMLLEAGFFTAFLGASRIEPSVIPILILRWMLFRTEIGAGLIKLRHDPCWRQLTCLYYHYETQPLPNPLSWYFHRIPAPLHRFSALFSHFVQVVVPFALFAPQPLASIAGALIIFHQLWLIVSGNYSWLNWLTMVLGVSAFSDRILSLAVPIAAPPLAPIPFTWHIILWILAVATLALSIQPALNLITPNQVMNTSYNPWHLVNAYGAFGNISRERYEIVLEGAADRLITPATQWREYAFKAKPGDPRRMPAQIAPYHLRLDWLVWFLPFSVAVAGHRIHVWRHDLWFIRFVHRLLVSDPAILKLMGKNPFPSEPPAHIRALFYQYSYTTPEEKRQTGAWWTRRQLGIYLDPVSLDTLRDI